MSSQVSNVISPENGTEDGTVNIIIQNKIESGIRNRIGDKIENRIHRRWNRHQNKWKRIKNICNRKKNKNRIYKRIKCQIMTSNIMTDVNYLCK